MKKEEKEQIASLFWTFSDLDSFQQYPEHNILRLFYDSEFEYYCNIIDVIGVIWNLRHYFRKRVRNII